ncbi:MAG: hypothetical protein AAAFM81_00915 [Pseudomonadota bacterium]
MKSGTLFFVLFLALYIGFELYVVEKTRYRTEPDYIYLQHIRAMYATASCDIDVTEKRTRFSQNFEYAMARAQDAVTTDGSSTDQSLVDRATTVRGEVDQLIEEYGCGHIELWKLFRLYEMLADRSPPIAR